MVQVGLTFARRRLAEWIISGCKLQLNYCFNQEQVWIVSVSAALCYRILAITTSLEEAQIALSQYASTKVPATEYFVDAEYTAGTSGSTHVASKLVRAKEWDGDMIGVLSISTFHPVTARDSEFKQLAEGVLRTKNISMPWEKEYLVQKLGECPEVPSLA